jgi:hypothetical protein
MNPAVEKAKVQQKVVAKAVAVCVFLENMPRS